MADYSITQKRKRPKDCYLDPRVKHLRVFWIGRDRLQRFMFVIELIDRGWYGLSHCDICEFV